MNPKDRAKLTNAIIGLIISIASVWLGAWAVHVLEPWAQGPAVVTAVFTGCAGIVLAVYRVIGDV